jgi:DNA-binding transcriptional ArsR family regulator
MVNQSALLDATFAALSDPTRRAILSRLSRSDASVGEIAHPFSVSLPAISRHLRVLESAGLIARRRQGRVHHLRLVAEPLQPAAEWIARQRRFWESRLDALEAYLEEAGRKESKRWSAASRQHGSGPRTSSAPNPPRRR